MDPVLRRPRIQPPGGATGHKARHGQKRKAGPPTTDAHAQSSARKEETNGGIHVSTALPQTRSAFSPSCEDLVNELQPLLGHLVASWQHRIRGLAAREAEAEQAARRLEAEAALARGLREEARADVARAEARKREAMELESRARHQMEEAKTLRDEAEAALSEASVQSAELRRRAEQLRLDELSLAAREKKLRVREQELARRKEAGARSNGRVERPEPQQLIPTAAAAAPSPATPAHTDTLTPAPTPAPHTEPPGSPPGRPAAPSSGAPPDRGGGGAGQEATTSSLPAAFTDHKHNDAQRDGLPHSGASQGTGAARRSPAHSGQRPQGAAAEAAAVTATGRHYAVADAASGRGSWGLPKPGAAVKAEPSWAAGAGEPPPLPWRQAPSGEDPPAGVAAHRPCAADGLVPPATAEPAKSEQPQKRGGRTGGSELKRPVLDDILREDVPGLLENLKDHGLLEHMEMLRNVPATAVNGDPPADLVTDLAELEELLGKLFGQAAAAREGPAGRAADGMALPGGIGKPGGRSQSQYCVEHLVALAEQAGSTHRNKWPVTWGWSRKLKAFLFVFERHNRIVLEWPYYGRATYFFEVEEGLPLSLQLRRLIAVMSSASVKRVDILENKALEVGDELSESEAKVLRKYGWTPDGGLGSMVNFSARLWHELRPESRVDLKVRVGEWRRKIGKMLMQGCDQGRRNKSSCDGEGGRQHGEEDVKGPLSFPGFPSGS